MLRAWIPAAALAALMISAAAQDEGHGRAMSMEQAVALRTRLADDVLVLHRAVRLQGLLLAWNGVRARHETGPVTLPRDLCRSPALAPYCDALPATFGGAP